MVAADVALDDVALVSAATELVAVVDFALELKFVNDNRNV